MAFVSDNAIDSEIPKMKAFLENLKMRQTIFSNTFHMMPPKERARNLSQIQGDHKTLIVFLDGAKKLEIVNSGTKFGLENIKQSFQTLMTLWRRTEKSLETFVGKAAKKEGQQDASEAHQNHIGQSESGQAVEKYVTALKNMGHAPSDDMVKEFKARLDDAYNKAKEKSGGKDLSIQIIQEGSKIKVRMEPK